jgi:diguanylate cyclase (GGDEF)-like protein
MVRQGDLAPRCKHVEEAGLTGDYLCLPMSAHAEAMGLFFLHCGKEACSSADPAPDPHSQNVARLARLVSQQAALALSNLKLRETLRVQSTQDPLTGLFNRRYLEETLGRELRRTERTLRPVSIILLDLDHFKSFNDRFGHPAGDLLLREVGELLKRGIRGGGDLAARYGGEEFVVVLPEAPLEQAENRANQLCKEIRALALSYHGQSLGAVTASMGVACYPDTAADFDGLLSAADTALYRAKAEGRNRVVVAQRTGEQAPA